MKKSLIAALLIALFISVGAPCVHASEPIVGKVPFTAPTFPSCFMRMEPEV